MNITAIHVRLVSGRAERLRAFCSITFDGEFVIRDVKIIDGPNGPFVAMPSRKLTERCRKCGSKNPLRARFCYECGVRLREPRVQRDEAGRARLHVDVAHPINAACRERLQNAIVEAYRAEVERSAQPGYRPAPVEHQDELDHEDAFDGTYYDELVAELRGGHQASRPPELSRDVYDTRSDATPGAGEKLPDFDRADVIPAASPATSGPIQTPAGLPTAKYQSAEEDFSQGIL
jgi:stage V sporulation protein G